MYRFSLDLIVAGEGKIDCDMHPVVIHRRDGTLHLSLAGEAIIPDRDIVLRFSCRDKSRDDSGIVYGSLKCHALRQGGAFIATGPLRRTPVIGDGGSPLCITSFAGILQRNRGGFLIFV